MVLKRKKKISSIVLEDKEEKMDTKATGFIGFVAED